MSLLSCPKCGSKEVERADNLTYTSNPPCYKYKCSDCGDYFYSTDSTNDCAFNDEFDNYNRKGWECPKCGRVFAPHVDECPYCGRNYNNQITCSNYSFGLIPPANRRGGLTSKE